jgi:hypothetical protein
MVLTLIDQEIAFYPAKFERISCSYHRDLYRVLRRNPKGKRQYGMGSCRWWVIVNWILKK